MPRLHRSQSCWTLAWAMAPCHLRPPWFGYFRRKEDVSSKPNSDCLGFGLSKQWLEVFPSENALIGQRAQMFVCLSCSGVGGASASQVENGFPGLWVGQSTGSNHPGPGCARGVVFQEVAEHHEVKTSFCLHFSLQTKAATETLCTGHCVPGPLWATCLQAS